MYAYEWVPYLSFNGHNYVRRYGAVGTATAWTGWTVLPTGRTWDVYRHLQHITTFTTLDEAKQYVEVTVALKEDA